MNSGVTALMVESLSKRAQLFSSLILSKAVFSHQLQCVCGSGFKKGVFQDVLMYEESCLDALAEHLLASEGPGLSSLSSPFHILTHFLVSLTKVFQTSSHEMVRVTTSETILIFLLIQLNCIGKTNHIPNRLICFSNSA